MNIKKIFSFSILLLIVLAFSSVFAEELENSPSWQSNDKNIDSTFPQDPRNKIWGVHFHMDVEKKNFPRALLIQEEFFRVFKEREDYTHANRSL